MDTNKLIGVVELTGLELFLYLIKHFNDMPHKALVSMIEHNQDVSEVKEYLEAMLIDIKKNGGIKNKDE